MELKGGMIVKIPLEIAFKVEVCALCDVSATVRTAGGAIVEISIFIWNGMWCVHPSFFIHLDFTELWTKL